MEAFFRQIGQYITDYGYKLLLAICVVVVGCGLAWLIGFLLKKLVARTRFDGAVVTFIVSILRIALVILSVLIAASILEVSTSGLVVSLSTVGLAIGLALKDSFANLANGILIIVNKPFRRGDYVSINGIEVKVYNIKLLTVELITIDNLKVVLPNSTVINKDVINYTALAIRRLDLEFSVDSVSDMNKVETSLKKVAAEHPQVLKSMNVTANMCEFSDTTIKYKLRCWVNNADYLEVKHSLPRLVFDEFEKQNIQLPSERLGFGGKLPLKETK